MVMDHCTSSKQNDFVRLTKFFKYAGRGELAHIKPKTLYDITKNMLTNVMSDNSVGGKFSKWNTDGNEPFPTRI